MFSCKVVTEMLRICRTRLLLESFIATPKAIVKRRLRQGGELFRIKCSSRRLLKCNLKDYEAADSSIDKCILLAWLVFELCA